MQSSAADCHRRPCSKRVSGARRANLRLAAAAAIFAFWPAEQAYCSDPSDPILNLFLQKGFITEAEASKAKAEIDAMRTNQFEMPAAPQSKWKINESIKSVRLFGDIRLRYESRSAEDPRGGEVQLDRMRYALRLGLAGEVFDNFYYGLRIDTSSNPRSSWVSMGTSSSGTTYQGPFGKSTATLAVGQAYLGWRPEDWVDFTVGKMANPLYTTTLLWDPDINPEGMSERFKASVGKAELFANFGQFLYQDVNPLSADGGLGFNGLVGQDTENIFLLTWQGGFKYNFTTNASAKLGAGIYKYANLQRSSGSSPSALSPYFGDPFIGEGASLLFPGSAAGYSGYGIDGTLPGYRSQGFPLNQVGVDNLLVVEVPFEFNFKIRKLNARVFGDVAYNLDGKDRAEAAAAAYSYVLSQTPTASVQTSPFGPQTDDVMAYQIGIAIGSKEGFAARHPWELKTYWQHTEQYSLDPNLIDSDTFEGRLNLEGINVQLSYGLTPNFIGSVRYAYATRINDKIGTGGANADIPQVNAIDVFSMLQLDLSLQF